MHTLTCIPTYTHTHANVGLPSSLTDVCGWGGRPRGDGGYGLVGYALEDAAAAGQYDAVHFNHREGFEDTDFLLRLLRLPRLLVRRREAGFVHRWHPPAAWTRAHNTGPWHANPLPPVC
jgi:hypothetical protein